MREQEARTVGTIFILYVCIALLAVLVIGLGLNVSLTRAATGMFIGQPEDSTAPLTKAVRAHGNAAEYNALFAILIYILASNDPATWVLWLFGIVTLARYLHAAGMLLSPDLSQAQPLRAAGTLGTYVGGFVLSGAILLLAY